MNLNPYTFSIVAPHSDAGSDILAAFKCFMCAICVYTPRSMNVLKADFDTFFMGTKAVLHVQKTDSIRHTQAGVCRFDFEFASQNSHLIQFCGQNLNNYPQKIADALRIADVTVKDFKRYNRFVNPKFLGVPIYMTPRLLICGTWVDDATTIWSRHYKRDFLQTHSGNVTEFCEKLELRIHNEHALYRAIFVDITPMLSCRFILEQDVIMDIYDCDVVNESYRKLLESRNSFKKPTKELMVFPKQPVLNTLWNRLVNNADEIQYPKRHRDSMDVYMANSNICVHPDMVYNGFNILTMMYLQDHKNFKERERVAQQQEPRFDQTW